jgi:hypothetical protein
MRLWTLLVEFETEPLLISSNGSALIETVLFTSLRETWKHCKAEILLKVTSLGFVPLALTACLTFIADSSALDKLPLSHKAVLRGALKKQLYEVGF